MASTPSNRSPSPPPMNGEGGGSAPRCASWVYSLSVSGRDTVEIPALPNQPAYSGRRREGTGRGGCWGVGAGGEGGWDEHLASCLRGGWRGGGVGAARPGPAEPASSATPPPTAVPDRPPTPAARRASAAARRTAAATGSARRASAPRLPSSTSAWRASPAALASALPGPAPAPAPTPPPAAPLPSHPPPPPTQLTRRVRVPRASDAATRSVPEPRGHTVAASTPPAARPSPAVPLLPTSPTSPLRTPPRPPPPPRAAPRRAPRVAPRAHSRDAGRARVRRPPRLLPAGWGRQLGPHGGGWVRGEAGGQRGGEERVCRGAVTLWPRPLCGVGVTHLGPCV